MSNTESRNDTAEAKELETFRRNRERDLRKLFENLKKMNIDPNNIRVFITRPRSDAGAEGVAKQFANEMPLRTASESQSPLKSRVVSNMKLQKFNESNDYEHEFIFGSPEELQHFLSLNKGVIVLVKSFDPTLRMWTLKIKLPTRHAY
jgi:hypothetical protein